MHKNVNYNLILLPYLLTIFKLSKGKRIISWFWQHFVKIDINIFNEKIKLINATDEIADIANVVIHFNVLNLVVVRRNKHES